MCRGEPSLGERRIDGQFVSIIYAVWDDERRTLQVANSGLPRPIISITERSRPSMRLDFRWGCSMKRSTTSLRSAPNRRPVLFYSDGIMDARDRDGRSLWKRTRGGTGTRVRNPIPDCVVRNIFKRE